MIAAVKSPCVLILCATNSSRQIRRGFLRSLHLSKSSWTFRSPNSFSHDLVTVPLTCQFHQVRHVRRGRYPTIPPPEEEAAESESQNKESDRDFSQAKSPNAGSSQSTREDFERPNNSAPRARPTKTEGYPDHLASAMETDRRRGAVRKFIHQNVSHYGAPMEGGRVGGDAFMTSAYVKGANVTFQQGNDAAEESLRRKIDPATTSVILFPGQGTQYVGMAGNPTRLPRYIQVLYEIASSILEYDLLDLCTNGPQQKLDQTVYSQPAILVSSLAALERLREQDPMSVEKCVATAGFSVGEITALVFAGVLSFEDAVRLVKVRAEAMQLSSELTPSGMATVLYGADSKLGYALNVAQEWCRREYNIEDPVCSVANYLFPHCKVVAGHTEALDFLEANYKDFNLKRVRRLPVSGAFHTPLMQPAMEPLKTALKGVTINRPRMLVFSNVKGFRYHSSGELIRLLPKQLVKPVLWEQIIQTIYQRPREAQYPYTFECGPGSSLTTVLKQVNNRAFLKCKAIPPSPTKNEEAKAEQ